MIQRRSFLTGLASMLAAPAIVHAGNLMPVKSYELWLDTLWQVGINSRGSYRWVAAPGSELLIPQGKITEIIFGGNDNSDRIISLEVRGQDGLATEIRTSDGVDSYVTVKGNDGSLYIGNPRNGETRSLVDPKKNFASLIYK
jgi:hypothetical protein